MSDRRRLDLERSRAFGWAGILVPLGLGFVLSVVLAYQILDADREHRAVARATVREHAEFAAFLLASQTSRPLGEALLYGFYPLDLASGRSPDEAAPPSVLRAEPELSRCEPLRSPAARVFFRLDLDSGDLVVDGEMEPALAHWIGDSLAARVRGQPEGVPFGHATTHTMIGGRPGLIAYRQLELAGRSLVYGFDSCWRTRDGDLFETAIERVQAFPPALVGDTPNDSLFELSARNGDGTLAFGREWALPGAEFHGTAAVQPREAFAGLELRVTLRREVAERLVVGGLPRSRLPIALGLVSLTALLMVVAAMQLRRGQELVRLRARFVANVSHELRTPLQQILLFVELLRADRLKGAAERKTALRVMYNETRRLIGLVENVLRFSSRDTDLRCVDLDLVEVVSEAVEAFRPLAESRQARLELDAPAALPVRADPDAVKRILINLLDNAVKYGPEGQTVRVELLERGARGQLAVEDEGPGVPPEKREQIWQPFERLDEEENGSSAGSGIGLSIVRRLSEAMDGSAEVRQSGSGGARFVVSLPSADGRAS